MLCLTFDVFAGVHKSNAKTKAELFIREMHQNKEIDFFHQTYNFTCHGEQKKFGKYTLGK